MSARGEKIELALVPVSAGVDAVTGWAQESLQSLVGNATDRAGKIRSVLDALGRGRTAAQEAEALLESLKQHGEAAPGATSLEAPDPAGSGEVALVLWQWYELARCAWTMGAAPDAAVPVLANQAKHLSSALRSRPTRAAEEIRRRLRLPRDAREAVREHEKVSAKLAEENIDAGKIAAARDNLLDFCLYLKKFFKSGPHLELICHTLERVERGECKRLILNMPPQHGKTEVVSRLFLTWYMGRHPDRDVLFATHTADYAERNIGKQIRRNLETDEFSRVFPNVKLRGDSKAAGAFEISASDDSRAKSGNFRAYGMGGGYTGNSADLMVFDDLLMERDARSEAMLQQAYESIQALYSRLGQNSAWIVVNTRYHLRDVVAYLMAEYPGEGWEVISLPAIAERDETFQLPGGRTWSRKIGDALFPHRFTAEKLASIKAQRMQTDPSSWWGQYQCRPVPEEGNIVQWAWFASRRYADDPRSLALSCVRITISVDTSAGKSDKAARTAISVWGERGADAYLLFCWAKSIPYTEQRQRVKEVCAEWHPHLLIIEDKSTGQALIPDLRADRSWACTPIHGEVPHGPKEDRMRAVTPQMAEGQVWLPIDGHPLAPWLQPFAEEMTFYPKGVFRDQGDTVSQFLGWRARNPLVAQTSGFSLGNAAAKLGVSIGGQWRHGSQNKRGGW